MFIIVNHIHNTVLLPIFCQKMKRVIYRGGRFNDLVFGPSVGLKTRRTRFRVGKF